MTTKRKKGKVHRRNYKDATIYVRNFDRRLLRRFKSACIAEGWTMNEVLQDMMYDFCKNPKAKPNVSIYKEDYDKRYVRPRSGDDLCQLNIRGIDQNLKARFKSVCALYEISMIEVIWILIRYYCNTLKYRDRLHAKKETHDWATLIENLGGGNG